jgi:hypothetical protein
MKHQIDLELLECRAFKNGCVLVKYHVKTLTQLLGEITQPLSSRG